MGLVFWTSIGWIAVVAFGAIFADVLPLRDPEELGIVTGEVERFEPPGANAWFGGDAQGKDLFSQVVFGSRPAMLLAVSVTVLAATLGTLVGLIAGYAKGRTDTVIMAIADAFFAFPSLVLLFSISATFGISLQILIPVFTILGIPAYARIVRGVTLALSEREFVDAARSMGATKRRILLRELAPNVAVPALAFAFLGFAIVIATEGALAFIGLGLDQTTWGSLIAEGQGVIREASHLALIPATVMFLTIMAFNYVGDGIRSLADTRPVLIATKLPSVNDTTVDTTVADNALLTVRNLRTSFPTAAGTVVAVDDVSLEVFAGRTLGVVGESGSGKTMLLRSIMGSFPIPSVQRSGLVSFEQTNLLTASDKERRHILGTEIGVVSQNPLTALNPVRTIGSQLVETMRVHTGLSRAEAKARAKDLLGQVGIPEPGRRLAQYPHQLSGGMRQRVTIALALANEPRLLLADEPTTALDVTIQDQILTLMKDLCDDRGMAMVLVTHDLSVVRGWTDDVAVMYGGQIVESGTTSDVFDNPAHRYTQALLESIPRLDLPGHSELAVIEGQPPALVDLPPGCRFSDRCRHSTVTCEEQTPLMTVNAQRTYRCWHPANETDQESNPDGR
jgi:peptide/nickel transport system permease protein